jgi:hypothetical protein
MLRIPLTIGLIASIAISVAGCGKSEQPPAPIAVNQRTITSAELGGLTAAAPAKAQTVAQFAKDHNKTVEELKASGMTAGTAQQFKLKGPGTTFSIVSSYHSADQAMAEAARLFKSNSEQEKGVTVKPLDISGVPGAHAVTLSGKQDGETFSGYEIVYSDGNLVYELFAIGTPDEVNADTGAKAVQSQFGRVQGHPLPTA